MFLFLYGRRAVSIACRRVMWIVLLVRERPTFDILLRGVMNRNFLANVSLARSAMVEPSRVMRCRWNGARRGGSYLAQAGPGL